MSLDIYIKLKKGEIAKRGTGIYVRENGKTKELSLEEAKAQYPGHDVQEYVTTTSELWHGNITHNLNKMAMAVNLDGRVKEYFYKMIWHPEDLETDPRENYRTMLLDLGEGLAILKEKPDEFKKHNPENGWGTYDGLVNFVDGYVEALDDAIEKFNPKNIEICVWA